MNNENESRELSYSDLKIITIRIFQQVLDDCIELNPFKITFSEDLLILVDELSSTRNEFDMALADFFHMIIVAESTTPDYILNKYNLEIIEDENTRLIFNSFVEVFYPQFINRFFTDGAALDNYTSLIYEKSKPRMRLGYEN